LEKLTGEPLRSLIEREGKLALAAASAVLLPVAEALGAAHELGIVHRDIKPDNIFLAKQSSGEVWPKVLDFGIVKLLDPASIDLTAGGNMTQTEMLLGSPKYMALEQALGTKDLDARTDIWALGVVAHELLVGERPLAFNTLGEMFSALLEAPMPSFAEALPDLPPDLVAALDGCLAKRREDRVDNLDALVAALRPHLDNAALSAVVRVEGAQAVSEYPPSFSESKGGTAADSVDAATAAAPPKPRSKLGMILGATAAVALGGVGTWALTRPADPPKPLPTASEKPTGTSATDTAQAEPSATAQPTATAVSAQPTTTATLTTNTAATRPVPTMSRRRPPPPQPTAGKPAATAPTATPSKPPAPSNPKGLQTANPYR